MIRVEVEFESAEEARLIGASLKGSSQALDMLLQNGTAEMPPHVYNSIVQERSLYARVADRLLKVGVN